MLMIIPVNILVQMKSITKLLNSHNFLGSGEHGKKRKTDEDES